jgi:hypothetical protein
MVENIKHIKKAGNFSLIGLFLCLFFLAGASPVSAGWFTAEFDNQSSVAWGDFHFLIYEIPGQEGNPLFDISNVTFDIEAPYMPSSGQTLDAGNEWNLSADGQQLSFNFYGDPVGPAETGWWKVRIDNPDGVVHGITSYPSVVPEPVSSALFVVGSATLAFRRYRKSKA